MSGSNHTKNKNVQPQLQNETFLKKKKRKKRVWFLTRQSRVSCTDQVEVVNFWPTPSRKLTVVSVLIFQFENKKQEQQLYFSTMFNYQEENHSSLMNQCLNES